MMGTNLILKGDEVDEKLVLKVSGFKRRLIVLRREKELEQFGIKGFFYFFILWRFVADNI